MSKDIIILLVTTLITITGWIVFESMGVSKKQNIPEEILVQSEELIPILDISTVQKIYGP
ncbi:hypothetical protein COT52_00655 [candidate division WWE3 bacterium CG08_land_8_20_14_0_20_43_13]|uniref:Uncharacterized protein n=1 Tax=candidate division WWE3 bacterium CG08_land_8_20_14_0_20_43_13 TaxID=1975087 RepID=A0A2H0XAE3_UNCKA|nr:MAG: hypothetical protein COT52_00655 [candidate division WWE3 bacterium CG08_land_8_20_14_0_20_43_13]